MAFLRRPRGNLAGAFRNSRDLQQFVLTDVTATGRILGTGSYGSVEEVTYQHLTCAGKKLHETLLDVENEGVAEIVRKYQQECQLMSNLHHPNITQFLGLCFFPGTQLPLLVMERLESSLDDLLEHMPNLPLSLKCSVLEDVASGLLYLHKRQPSVIHRDLTSKNVLLTSSLVAKITDMGNSRIIDMRPDQMARTLSKLPGTLAYMPPEALDDRHRYGFSLDIFSFGHLALFTAIQTFPGDLLPGTYPNPDNTREVRGRTELERRGKYIDVLEAEFGRLYSPLVELVKQCLHNVPDDRPNTDELLTRLQRVRAEVEGGCGGRSMNFDIMMKLRFAKEIKMKDRRIDEQETELEEKTRVLEATAGELEGKTRELGDTRQELGDTRRELGDTRQELGDTRQELGDTRQELGDTRQELGDTRRQLDEKTRRLEERDRHVEELQADSQRKDREMATQRQQIQRRVEELQADSQRKDREMATQRQQIQELRTDLQLRETRLREELQSKEAENSRLREELRKCQGLPHAQEGAEKVSLKLPLQLRWRCGPDMPFEMYGYVQSVLVQDTVYVGGGHGCGVGNSYIVMAYDIGSGKWAKLPPYRTYYFAMTVINNQLVLVGGSYRDSNESKALGVWTAGNKKWTQCFPEMITPRSRCSATVHKKWLVVTGGFSPEGLTSSVEVLNTDSKQWYAGHPTPTPWMGMKTAIVGDVCYFMGGYTGPEGASSAELTASVYSVSVPVLLSHLNPTDKRKDTQIWKEISILKHDSSAPLSIGGSLLAIGGRDKDCKDASAVRLLRPDSGEWIKIGDLPTPQYDCTCTVITDSKLFVAGGWDGSGELKRVDIATMK